jgi:hypothetical protein
MIPDMDTETAENQVKKVLERLPGIRYVRLVQRGALVRDKPSSIGPDEIRTAIRQSGFRASTFSGLEDRDAGTSVDRRGTEPNSLGKKPDGTLSSQRADAGGYLAAVIGCRSAMICRVTSLGASKSTKCL